MKRGDRYDPAPAGPPRLGSHAECGGKVGIDLFCERCGAHPGPGQIDLRPGRVSKRGANATPLIVFSAAQPCEGGDGKGDGGPGLENRARYRASRRI
jgi:hypothetical protein